MRVNTEAASADGFGRSQTLKEFGRNYLSTKYRKEVLRTLWSPYLPRSAKSCENDALVAS